MKAENLVTLREMGLPVPPFIAVKDESEIDLSFSDADRFAVRSSFDAEDGADASFAGQFDTVLNVERADVREAFLKVRESSKQKSIQIYRQAMKRSAEDKAFDMTVIIQEMVDSEISGVIFTANPLGILNETVIVAGFGQGCNVVEDRTEVSTYYYNTTDEIYLRDGDASTPDLTPDRIKRLVEMSKKIREHFQREMDIEFAISGDEIFVLQARPVSTLDEGEKIVLDNSNIVESYPGVSLPATQSFVHEIYYKVFKAVCTRVTGDEKLISEMDDKLRHMTDAVNGRIYYRISNWYTILELLPFSGKIIPVWQEMLGVEQKNVTYTDLKVRLSTKLRLVRRFIGYLFKTPKLMIRLDMFFKEAISGYQSRIDGTDDIESLLALYEDIKKELTSVWDITLLNDMCAFIFTALSGKKNKEKIAMIRDLESMKPVMAMREVIRTANESGLQSREYNEKKSSYISLYGDRITEELKLETKTYRTNPELLDEYVRQHMDDDYAEELPDEAAQKRRENVFVRQAKTAIRNREISRLDRSRIFGIMRAILLKVGASLKKQDYIDDIYDVFYLFYDEICGGGRDEYRELVASRKVEYESYKDIPAFSRLVFLNKVVPKKLKNVTVYRSRKDVFTGTPVSEGKTVGEILIIDKAELGIDTTGKIIVTKMTDPGWVFLIQNCKGVIAERGSLLSHTAIVTRELKKPAVVNVRNATSLFKNGDLVELDAYDGTIRVIGDSEGVRQQ